MKNAFIAAGLVAVTLLLFGRSATGAQNEPSIPPPSSITQMSPSSQNFAPVSSGSRSVSGATAGNVRVSSNPQTFARPQVEPSVASNPVDPTQLVAGFADLQDDPVNYDSAPGVAISGDSGQTWSAPSGGPTLPNPPGFVWGNRGVSNYLASGDSAIAWGRGNTVYFSTIGFHDNRFPPDGDCSSGGLYVYRSDDGGNNWTLPAKGPAMVNTQTIFRDKPYVAADSSPDSPFANRLYVVWDDDVYSGCPQFFPSTFVRRDISFSFSDDGATWSAPIALASGCLIGAVPAVAANGDLHVVWYDCNSGIRQVVRKSTDGGLSFGPQVTAASGLVPPPNPLLGSRFRVNAPFPAIATDPTNFNNVYVTWSSDNGPSHTDVFVSRSIDAGNTWSFPPVRVNDDPIGNPRDQFFPWIAVMADGTVRVSWGDNRLDTINPNGKDYDIFIADSVDNGETFGANQRVSTESSNPDYDGYGGTFIGDYFGLASAGVPVWGDTRLQKQAIFGAFF